ncbi:glycosyltransferase [Kaistella carnis]|uniref:Glycosyltransferase family 1 protein n=1 Tax=Kaistella carnis TaxID=1241979 RepID=A0A3G8XXS2_9FLAO|nr:glycosyltransferase [Kaistella carnis]AZI33046.1 glycosyltransferase family 1 protein [Kaistella carnis]
MEDKNKNFGLNISGYINKQFGLGEGVRSNVRAVKTTSVPFVINDFNIVISKHIQDDVQNALETTSENPYDVNLVQINIDRLHSVLQETDNSYFKDKYNIAFWAWELENFPDESKVFFTLFDEIWVPSNFCAEAISKISPVPVIKIMHSIEIEKTTMKRRDFNLPEDSFIFMTMFDYYSSVARKNPLATIEAYEKSFGKNNRDVLLIIKTSLSIEFPEEKKMLLERIADNKSIIVYEEIMERDKLYSLMSCCDSFVSLHRSEGFGLTMAEAMYLGKPVIATGYSANLEFMNVNNSFLVKFDVVPTGDQYYFSTEKDFWADPNVSHASTLMKIVVENPEIAKEIALQGQLDVQKNLSPSKMGEKIEARLRYINDTIIPNKSKENSQDIQFYKFKNELLQKKIDKMKTLFGVRLKLKFKNLQNKITGKNRKYFWE